MSAFSACGAANGGLSEWPLEIAPAPSDAPYGWRNRKAPGRLSFQN